MTLDTLIETRTGNNLGRSSIPNAPLQDAVGCVANNTISRVEGASGNKAIAFFTGINVRLAGRLSRQSIIPRKTVKTIQKGSLARRHTDFLTISKYTAKNRRGIFCYTITIGHKYY